MGVSLKPSEQTDFAGLEGAHIIASARFQTFEYVKDGRVTNTGVGLMLKCKTVEGEDREQFYSAGATDRWEPADDGLSLDAISGEGQIRKSSNLGIFLAELDSAGFGEEEFDDDVSVIDGMILDFIPKEIKRSGGRVKAESTLPVAGNILARPDEDNDWRKKFKAGASKSTKGASASAGSRRKKGSSRRSRASASAEADESASGADNGALDARAREYVLKVLTEYEEVPRDEISDLVLKKARKDPDRKDLAARVHEEDFLGAYADDWEYADETIYALEEEA